AEIDYGQLTVTPVDDDSVRRPRLRGSVKPIAEFGAPQSGVLYLDSAAMEGSPRWELRPWRKGDRMRPFGMKGSKLLSDLFASARLTAAQRRSQHVLTRNDVIIWAVGLRASAHFPVTARSTEYIEIHAET
ncbi:MAG: tRNA lysidine(34) synthetase TilS, partial [Muribaculaceae bacterium]|nr:tRNA lysidine(34) synthetase TilS [Muribaculaceae bacterium]